MLSYNRALLKHSRSLRTNMTDAERRIWSRLRLKQLDGLQFYRQKIIGDYIVDFYCHQARLVIEVDGSQHQSPVMAEADGIRDRYLSDRGLKVLRFNDYDALRNTDGVVEVILRSVRSRDSEIPLSPPL